MVNQNISQETNTVCHTHQPANSHVQQLTLRKTQHALVLCLVVSILFVIVRGFARYFKLQQFPSDAEDIAM